jgi:uncharacterized protein YmfQ (DUF2313 family)
MKTCAWCANDFKASVSYQIYCSSDCRESATKQKIAERYQINRRKSRSKKERRCSGGCGTLISIYNENGFCNFCMVNKKRVDKTLKELKDMSDDE